MKFIKCKKTIAIDQQMQSIHNGLLPMSPPANNCSTIFPEQMQQVAHLIHRIHYNLFGHIGTHIGRVHHSLTLRLDIAASLFDSTRSTNKQSTLGEGQALSYSLNRSTSSMNHSLSSKYCPKIKIIKIREKCIR